MTALMPQTYSNLPLTRPSIQSYGQSQVSPLQIPQGYQTQQVPTAPYLQMQDLGSQVYSQQFLADQLRAIPYSGQTLTPTSGANMASQQAMQNAWLQNYNNQLQNQYNNQYNQQTQLQSQPQNGLLNAVLNGLDSELGLAYKLIRDLLPVVDAYGDMTQSAINYKDAANRLGFIFESQSRYIYELEKTVNMLVPFVNAANIWAVDSFQHEQVLKSVLPFVDIANIWATDSFQHEQVLKSVLSCLQDPAFLAYWAFKVWSNQQLTIEDIQYLGANFQELLSPYIAMQNNNNTTGFVNSYPQAQQLPRQTGIPYRMPVTVNLPTAQNIPTPTPVSYNSSNTNNPLLQVLNAMRSQGVNGLINARKAGVI